MDNIINKIMNKIIGIIGKGLLFCIFLPFLIMAYMHKRKNKKYLIIKRPRNTPWQ
ncbi:hypothetical protein K9M79_08130 [Candidatus Woesearchaeota archaeon]|nr:hypothetical protein [Candidatus Woesearchaeota archaeon]